MDLYLEKLSYEETKAYYEESEDMRTYVELCIRGRDITVDEVLKHDIVQTVAWLKRNNGGNI